MKIILAAAALVAALASPAVAQDADALYVQDRGPSYIYPPDRHPHSSNPAWDVYDTRGRYVGSDPDPFIRDYLARGRGND